MKLNEASEDIALQIVPVPHIDENEILVRVHAIGVGIHDSYFLPKEISYPFPIGIEASGVIEAVGASATEFSVGERVAFVSSMQRKGGTWAEYSVVSKDALITPIPDAMTFEQAAAVPVAGNTILRALTALEMKPAGSVFFAGASGAIGTFAIQLAKSYGWRVAASASSANREYLLSLGANLAVDYRDENWVEHVLEWMPGGVDAAVAIQPETSAASMRTVRDGGRLLTVSGDRLETQRGINATGLPYGADVRKQLSDLMTAIADGTFTLTIEQSYPFDAALNALHKTQTRHARGKLVVRVD